MEEPIFVECKGCWTLFVLGFSTREKKEVVTDKEGNVKAIIYRPLPAHDHEVCPDCGREYEFPPLDERPPDEEDYEYDPLTFRFGPRCWPEPAEENFRCLQTKSFNGLSSLW
jgi:hypothetical protein